MSDAGPGAWPSLRVFIQARMSSRRFPGKVLAPFRGEPLVGHVVSAVQVAFGSAVPAVVVTSHAPSDDPLVAYLESRSIDVFRGPLEDVLSRFVMALDRYPCDWVMRLSADSPIVSPAILRQVESERRADEDDLVTTTWPRRTFRVGQNVEIVRAGRFVELAQAPLTQDEREHVTRGFYARPNCYRIRSVVSSDPTQATQSVAVDEVGDLLRLEALDADELFELGWCGARAGC